MAKRKVIKMITTSEFVEIIDDLRDANDFVDETNKRARKLKDAIVSDFYNTMSLAISHEGTVVRLLENMFQDSDTISWWLYELDYGRKYKQYCIQDSNGKYIDLSTAEKLYDYLIERGYKVQPLSRGSFKGIPFEKGGGFKVNWGGDRILQYHPCNASHHGGAYFKISSGTTGTIRIDLKGNIIE